MRVHTTILFACILAPSSMHAAVTPITLDMHRQVEKSLLQELLQPLGDTVAHLLGPLTVGEGGGPRFDDVQKKPTGHLGRLDAVPSNTAPPARSSSGASASKMVNDLWSYAITLGVGTPPLSFKVIFDTGSPVLWIPDKDCKQSSCPGATEQYAPSKSSSFVRVKNDLAVEYGSGKIQGHVMQDTVSFFDASETVKVKVQNQSIGVAMRVEAHLLSDGINGIIGFAPSQATKDYNTEHKQLLNPMENLVAQKLVPQNVFSVYFKPIRVPEDIDTVGGQLTLGGFPSQDTYNGEIQWSSMRQNSSLSNYWAISMDTITIQNASIQVGGEGIVDTGTTMVVVQVKAAEAMAKQIPQAQYNDTLGLYAVPCKNIKNLPKIIFQLGNNVRLEWGPEQYTVPSWQAFYWGADANTCPMYFVGEPLDGYEFILGQKFLESFVSVYDGQQRRVGFAPSKQ